MWLFVWRGLRQEPASTEHAISSNIEVSPHQLNMPFLRILKSANKKLRVAESKRILKLKAETQRLESTEAMTSHLMKCREVLLVGWYSNVYVYIYIYVYKVRRGLYWDNGKENGNYYIKTR